MFCPCFRFRVFCIFLASFACVGYFPVCRVCAFLPFSYFARMFFAFFRAFRAFRGFRGFRAFRAFRVFRVFRFFRVFRVFAFSSPPPLSQDTQSVSTGGGGGRGQWPVAATHCCQGPKCLSDFEATTILLSQKIVRIFFLSRAT